MRFTADVVPYRSIRTFLHRAIVIFARIGDNRSPIDSGGFTLCDHAMRENYMAIRVAHRCEMNATTHKLGLRGFHVEKKKERKKRPLRWRRVIIKKKKVSTHERWPNRLKIYPDNDAEFYVIPFSKIMDKRGAAFYGGCNIACIALTAREILMSKK